MSEETQTETVKRGRKPMNALAAETIKQARLLNKLLTLWVDADDQTRAAFKEEADKVPYK